MNFRSPFSSSTASAIAADRPLIQGMAMRLLAGQNDCGGWTYNCPTMTPQEMLQLFNFLHSNKKLNLLDPLQGNTPGRGPAARARQDENPFHGFETPWPKTRRPMPKRPAKIRPKVAADPAQHASGQYAESVRSSATRERGKARWPSARRRGQFQHAVRPPGLVDRRSA